MSYIYACGHTKMQVWTIVSLYLSHNYSVKTPIVKMKCLDTSKFVFNENIIGGIAPNQVIARSEFEVHRQMFTE